MLVFPPCAPASPLDPSPASGAKLDQQDGGKKQLPEIASCKEQPLAKTQQASAARSCLPTAWYFRERPSAGWDAAEQSSQREDTLVLTLPVDRPRMTALCSSAAWAAPHALLCSAALGETVQTPSVSPAPRTLPRHSSKILSLELPRVEAASPPKGGRAAVDTPWWQ